MQFQLLWYTLILCTYNTCAANSHTAADCSSSDPSIINTTFSCPIDTHAAPDVDAPPLSLLASELSRPIDCGCNFYTSRGVGCHMARGDLKRGIKWFLPQLWFLWRKVKARLRFPPTEASHSRQINERACACVLFGKSLLDRCSSCSLVSKWSHPSFREVSGPNYTSSHPTTWRSSFLFPVPCSVVSA